MSELQWSIGSFGSDRVRFLHNNIVLILGALAATLLGVLTAVELDLFIATGRRLLHLAGQDDLMNTAAPAIFAGLMCWVIYGLVVRAITRTALSPYEALVDHFERLADGDVDFQIVLRGQVPEARRLARAVGVIHRRALACEQSKAKLQVRYDSLYEEHARERRLFITMLAGPRLELHGQPYSYRSPVGLAPNDFEPNKSPSEVPELMTS